MTRNPFVNASVAFAYIIIVASIMWYGSAFVEHSKSVIAPIAVLSLFTLSAALMGYCFFYYPVQMYLDGKKKHALDLFIKTLLSFAAITIMVFIVFFSGIYKNFL